MAFSVPASSSGALLSDFDGVYAELLRLLVRRTGSLDDARDLLHDTWLRLAEEAAPPPAEPLRSPGAYLSTMAQNLALDQLRRDRRRSAHLADAAAQTLAAPRHAPDVADAVMYRQAIDHVARCLDSLPRRCRDIFLAYRLDGERQADIAARLGLSLNTVERDLMQANAVIEDALHRWRGEVPPGPARRGGRRRGLATLLGCAGLLTMAGMLSMRFIRERSEPILWQVSLSTRRGLRSGQDLPDGSRIELDAVSAAEVRYRAHGRAVELLRGAAFFAVVRDAARPFTVAAGPVTATVLGTRFGVERGMDGAVLVQVESGRVRVSRGAGEAVELGAGQSLRVEPGRPWPAPRADAAPALWRQGELAFEDRPLGEVLERLERYAAFPLSADARAAALPVSGRWRIARAADWIAALPRSLPVRVERDAEGGMRVTAR
ncbi:sigma-70 family RNA polymerase sigma factor [Xylophilus sp.]|uniref:sigma-70 family RNA polymerase sigma factor n=1 Tax=Xylophilus sp. TaxID=2653893 RepID=UPI0013BD8536|nr:sigma-70 family RNA polymerase sigma factor [Xylophilus sp.]KAF1047771.1 MAG: Protein FecR [Xylophilus sp.]